MAQLMCLDMDHTLIDCDCLDELGREFGVREEIKEITELAMQDKFGVREGILMRLELLKGLHVDRLREIAREMPLMPGAEEMVAGARRKGWELCIITAGFDMVAEEIAKRLGIKFYVANKLEEEEGRLTGDFELIVERNKDKHLARMKEKIAAGRTVAVGDGGFDIPMIRKADIGIAFCAREAVQKAADVKVMEKDLRHVLKAI